MFAVGSRDGIEAHFWEDFGAGRINQINSRSIQVSCDYETNATESTVKRHFFLVAMPLILGVD